MSHDHHDGDATLTEQAVASFDGTPSHHWRAPMQRPVRRRHALVLDRS
ncbi:hypothetical protein [Burkholderia lata]|nr:hypothetical protein [Burkholderia lata]